MNRPEPESPEADRRSREAAEWLARRDRGLSATEQDEFLQWLAADPRHGEWFALHRAVVRDFTALAEWRPQHSEEPNPDLLAPPRRRIRWLPPTLLLAAAAAIAIGLGVYRHASESNTPPLARRLLEDGSSVELNRGAIVRESSTPKDRRIELVNGEAFFSVTKNPARPFIVKAGDVSVRAVGTAFSVRREAGVVEVLVTEGRVGVTRQVAGAASGPTEAATYLDAGQRTTVSVSTAAAPEVEAATAAQLARHLAWQPQVLDFSSAPLSVAVAEFNRRNRVQFEIADRDLAEMPIVASIRSDNVEGFAEFLASAPGIQVEHRGDNIFVVHHKH